MVRLLLVTLLSNLVSVKVTISCVVMNSLASCHLALRPLIFQVASHAVCLFFCLSATFLVDTLLRDLSESCCPFVCICLEDLLG